MVNKSVKAFTLIELSITLVIIAILISGILIGQDLIKSSQIRSLITDLNSYLTAMNNFKLKYNCMAGDCPNASKFLNTVNNGNGNFFIDLYTTNDEVLYVWHHLSLAGMIPGTYTGAYVSGAQIVGINIPAARISGVGFSFDSEGSIYGRFLPGIQVGSNNGNCCGAYNGAALTPAQANMIDSKIDDGMPAMGKLFAIRGYDVAFSNFCISQPISYTGALSNVTYLLTTDTSVSCRVRYLEY